MSRLAVLLFILATCASGCRHVAHLEVKDIPPPPCPAPVPPISTQQEAVRVTPEAVPAEKGFAIPSKVEQERASATPTPANHLGHIASSKKESSCESVRATVGASKVDETTITLTVASKPASAPKIEVAEKASPKNHFKTSTPAFSRDFWYGIATVLGAVFTTILAPIVVDMAKGRMASARNSADASRPITT